LACSLASAQAATDTKVQDPPAVEKAVQAWLDSDQVDEALLQIAAKAVLADTKGLPWLGKRLIPAIAAPAEKGNKGLTVLAMHVTLGFLERAKQSGMVYRGQYSELAALQPFAVNLLFQLLLETPDWYPHTERGRLVPAIRDLQSTRPDDRRLEAVVDIVDDVEREPAELRYALSCLLWQWGRREHLIVRIDELKRESMEGDAADRVLAMRALAKLWYDVEDYAKASQTHASLTKLAASSSVPLSPTDWYWAACCHAMRGDVDQGIAALTECAKMQASDAVDESHKLPRSLFERDPEIAKLRADARFAGLLEIAFPKARAAKGP
jgi:hypothetical protein